MQKNQKGFTIIELIVVIAIIAVLATIVMVNVTQYINKGRDAAVIGNLNSMATNAAVYFDDSTNTQTGTAYLASPNAQAAITAIGESDNAASVVSHGGATGVQDWCVEATTYNKGIQCVDNTGFIGEISATHCSDTVFTCK
jgi:prepilin-type N-terminal cleavage/methylation domain-containing protein